MNEGDAIAPPEQRIPAILLLQRHLKYGFIQMTHNSIKFLDMLHQEMAVSKLSLHQVECLNVSLIQLTKLQIVRDATQTIQGEDFDYYASTFSQSMAVTPTSHEKYFDKRLLLLFGSDPIDTLNQLSGKQGLNAIEVVDELGQMFVAVTGTELVMQAARYIFSVVKYGKLFQNANRLLPNVIWTYRMSEANINFPLKLPISAEDYRYLKYNYCKEALRKPKMMRHVDNSIDNLIRCVFSGISRKNSSEFKYLFRKRTSHIIASFTLYQSLFSYFPAQLYSTNISIIYNFSNGQGLTRLLACLPSSSRTESLGVAAFLNTDYRRASISCQAEFSKEVLLTFRTVEKEIVILLFDDLSKSLGTQQTGLLFVNMTQKRAESFENCSVFVSTECIQVLDVEYQLVFHVGKHLDELTSGKELFVGRRRASQLVVEIAELEAWKFVL